MNYIVKIILGIYLLWMHDKCCNFCLSFLESEEFALQTLQIAFQVEQLNIVPHSKK